MKTFILYLVPVLLCGVFHGNILSQNAPPLGSAQSFAVLGSATITNTGNTVITGNMGVSPGSAITGFPPGIIVNGKQYSGAASLAGNAQNDAVTAYNDILANTVPAGNDLTGKALGGTPGTIILNPGVYFFSSSAQLNGTLTLNDGGNPNAVFIFKIGSTITTASYSKVIMSSGGNGPNVFWQVGSSATIGTYTNFIGTIIAKASITMTTSATTSGRLFALNGAVTLDGNTASANVNSVLPITILSFSGITNGCKTNLVWQTANEINSALYGIEYSKGSSAFVQIGSVASKSSALGSTYGFNYTLSSGNNYFRLKAVDADGNFSYSKTIAINGNGSCGIDVQVKVSPNPAKDVINIGGVANGSHIALIGISGKKNLEIIASGSNEHINISGYAKGIYILKVESVGGNIVNTRVVVQ